MVVSLPTAPAPATAPGSVARRLDEPRPGRRRRAPDRAGPRHQPARPRLRGAHRRRPAPRPSDWRRTRRPTWSSSTSACPTSTASTSSRGLRGWTERADPGALGAHRQHRQGRRPRRRRRRLRHQAVRHGRAAGPAARRCCAARRPAEDRARRSSSATSPSTWPPRRVTARRRRRSASPRPSGTCSRSWSATPASCSASASCSQRGLGTRLRDTRRATCGSTWRQLRRKLEADPARPRHLRHRARHGLPLRALEASGLRMATRSAPVKRLRQPRIRLTLAGAAGAFFAIAHPTVCDRRSPRAVNPCNPRRVLGRGTRPKEKRQDRFSAVDFPGRHQSERVHSSPREAARPGPPRQRREPSPTGCPKSPTSTTSWPPTAGNSPFTRAVTGSGRCATGSPARPTPAGPPGG